MRKLSKIINKRRLNYKPTIGLEFESGKRISVRLAEYLAYLKYKADQEEAERRQIAWEFFIDFMKKEDPKFFEVFDAFNASLYY